MLGQLEGYDSRENRLRKERLYKEMLDNQIIMNRKYKEEQSRRDQRSNGWTSSREINRRARKKEEMDDALDESYVRRLRGSRDTVGRHYLPNLEDRNMLYRGTSRYLALDESYRINPAKKMRTEIIKADQQSYDDPVIQRLIEQLQVINKCKPRPHPKRVKHLLPRRDKRPNYYSHMPSPQRSHMPVSHQQTDHENIGKKRESPKLQPSPLERISQLQGMQGNADSLTKNDKINKQEDELKKLKNRQRLLSNRQSFLEVLRKVKNRGESLHVKFSKDSVQAGKAQTVLVPDTGV